MKTRFLPSMVLIAAALPLGVALIAQQDRSSDGLAEAWGKSYKTSRKPPRKRPLADLSVVHRWNAVTLAANALDHTPVAPDQSRVFGEQLGPGRTSRAFAIVHIAMFEAANAILGGYRSYVGLSPSAWPASVDVAVAQAAHDTLSALYPSQAATFDGLLAEDLGRHGKAPAIKNGVAVGRQAAQSILARRASDGSAAPDMQVGIDFFPSDQPGKWRPDPISQGPLALGAVWGHVVPFVLRSADFVAPQPPPDLASKEYAAAFNEVKRLGGDGIKTPTERTADQTITAIFWGYDGTPGLGTPPRLYNQIVVQIASEQHVGVLELARLLALVNVSMADVSMTCWDEKYVYQFWRPVTAIREADAGTGPTGLGDSNPHTKGDVTFSPLGAPASNLRGPNFTPPFPAYPSGHASFGSATFQVLRRFLGTDRIEFTFVSDEFDGETTDNTGRARPRIPRSFDSLSQAETENGQSRIYLGIHWAFDRTRGMSQGRQVADYVVDHLFPRAGR